MKRYEFNDNTRVDVIINDNAATLRVYVHKDFYNLRDELINEDLRKLIYNIIADIEPTYYNKTIAKEIHEKWISRFIASGNGIYSIQDHRHQVDDNIDVWFHIDGKDMVITWFKY